ETDEAYASKESEWRAHTREKHATRAKGARRTTGAGRARAKPCAIKIRKAVRRRACEGRPKLNGRVIGICLECKPSKIKI
ncbi:Unknown protein, partial [Striga hermonthica]